MAGLLLVAGFLLVVLGTTMMCQGQKKQALPQPPLVCRPSPPRGPSLIPVDSQGKCPGPDKDKDMKAVKGKDGKIMFCRNMKPPQPPMVCKSAELPKK